MQNLLEVTNVKQHFPIHSGLLLRRTGTVHAVDGVSLTIKPGETVGLVGESGCGKSTLGRTVIKIYEPTSGAIRFKGEDTKHLKGAALHAFRRQVQMIFQDPYSSLNPRKTISSIIDLPMSIHNMGTEGERKDRIVNLLERVGLGRWALNRYPHEFSGGQRQRIAIARAIALQPDLVIADEPVSALDVSVQSQILNLMQDLQDEFKMAYLFIAHDLAVVKHVANRVAVMYLGMIAEMADRDDLFKEPKHPYTKALMASNPVPGAGRKRHRQTLKGDVPSPVNPPSGCRFHPRCPVAIDKCSSEVPPLLNVGTGTKPYMVACHLVTKA